MKIQLIFSTNFFSSLDINSRHLENIQKDLLNYISFRVNNSPSIQSNLVTGAAGQYRFCQHLLGLCRGSFLFAKLTLDLFERGHLVAKSTSFKVLPVTLAQIYQLHFNLRFPTDSAFQKVSLCWFCLGILLAYEFLHANGFSGNWFSGKRICNFGPLPSRIAQRKMFRLIIDFSFDNSRGIRYLILVNFITDIKIIYLNTNSSR